MKNNILILVFLPLAYSAPAELTNSVTKDKSIAAPVPNVTKSKADKVPTPAPKSAGTPEDKDAYRMPASEINDVLERFKTSLSYNNRLLPQSIVAPAYSVPAPVIAAPPQFVWPSYSKYQFAQPYGYGASSWGSSWASPSPAYYQSVPAVSHFSPVSQPASVINSGHIAQSIPVVSPHVHTLPAVQPVAVSQTTVAKPVVSMSQHVVQQPVYDISQQVIHKPVHTEILEKIRRPVVTEVEEIIHKPVVTYLQQVIKRPLYAEHIIKPASYNQVSQSIYQAPLKLQGQSVHVVEKPSTQSIQLPTQVVQPVATHVVQTPAVHQELSTVTSYHVPSKPVSTGVVYGGYPSYGYGSYSSGYGLGSGYYGSSYGLGSSYGSSYGLGSGYGSSYGYLPYAYGSGYGSGYGYGGLSGASVGEKYQSYLVPSTCRATGTCGRDATSLEIQNDHLLEVRVRDNRAAHIRFISLQKSNGPSNMFETDLPKLLENPEFKTRYSKLIKENWPEEDLFDQDLISRLLNHAFKTNFVELLKETSLKNTA